MNCITLLPNCVLRGQSFQYVLVYNFTNIHAMSHRSDFFACSCRVNIEEPTVCFTVSLPSAASQVASLRFLIPTAMSDSISINTSSLEVMISSKNERVFIRDLSDLTLQIVFDASWASLNVGSKRPNAWDNSRHASSWRFYLHCGIEETGQPSHDKYCSSSSSSPSIRTWDQLNGETLAGKSSHRNVKRINGVRGYRID